MAARRTADETSTAEDGATAAVSPLPVAPGPEGDEDVEPVPKRSRTVTETSFVSIHDEASSVADQLSVAESATGEAPGIAGVAAAQGPVLGAEPTNGQTPSLASLFSSANMEGRVLLLREFCVRSGKIWRGNMHHNFRRVARQGNEEFVKASAVYREEVIGEVIFHLGLSTLYPDSIPQWIREEVEQFIARDLRFFASDPPAVEEAPAPSVAPEVQGASSSSPSPANARPKEALRLAPGFGKGPKRTAKRRR